MINNNEKYLVIKTFIDRKGNKHRARKEPYLYGELPKYQRDNPVFCVPATDNSVEVKSYGVEKEEPITNFSEQPIKIEKKEVEFKQKSNIKKSSKKKDVEKVSEEKESDKKSSSSKDT